MAMQMLIGVTRIINMLNLDTSLNTAKMEEYLSKHGVNPVGMDARENTQWAKADIEKLIETRKKSKEVENKPVDKLVGDTEDRRVERRTLAEIQQQLARILARNQELKDREDMAVKRRQSNTDAITHNMNVLHTDAEENKAVIRAMALNQSQILQEIQEIKEDIFDLRPFVLTGSLANDKPDEKIIHKKTNDKPKLTIGIVGITPQFSTIIQKEFGDVLNLRMLGPNEPNRIVGLKNADKIFGVRSGMQSKHTTAIKELGQEPIMIDGGITRLREAIENYYLAQ